MDPRPSPSRRDRVRNERLPGGTRRDVVGTVVFLPDPTVRREAVAEEDGTVVLAVGGTPGTFAQSEWEKRWLAHVGELPGAGG